MRVTIKNAGKKVVRVRFSPPKTTEFKLVSAGTADIAPGLSIVAEVHFLTTLDNDANDRLVVLTERERLVIPLTATQPCPELEFDPLLRFGTVPVGAHRVAKIGFRNSGAQQGQLNLVYDESLPLRLTPKVAVLGPGESVPVKVEFFGNERGAFRALVQVEFSGQAAKLLDINASVLDHSLELRGTDGRDLALLDFGALFHGQNRSISAVIYNSGPQQVNITSGLEVFRPPRGPDGEELPTPHPFAAYAPPPPDDNVEEAEDRVGAPLDEQERNERAAERRRRLQASWRFEVTPKETLVPAYGSAEVKITFRPRPSAPTDKGFKANPIVLAEENFVNTVAFQSPDGKFRVSLPVRGKGVRLDADLDLSKAINFGECPVGADSRLDAKVILKNPSPVLPYSFETTRVAGFRCEPSSGTVKPLSEQTLIFTFCPGQLGPFKKSMTVTYEGGLKSTVVGLAGVGIPSRTAAATAAEAVKAAHGVSDTAKARAATAASIASVRGRPRTAVGGPGALPSDFSPEKKFIDLEDVARAAPPHAAGAAAPNNTMLRGKLTTTIANAGDLRPEYTYSAEELMARALRRDAANAEIVKARADKVAADAAERKRAKLRFQNEVDLGIEPGSGLQEPLLELPREVDPLYLSGKPASAKAAMRSTKGFNPDKLIKNKFKPAPATKAEATECAMPLVPEQLARVHREQKAIDFGTLPVHATVKKSWVVVNDLSQSILVELQGLEDELAMTHPVSQVIPPGATAGYDIALCSNTALSYAKSITYLINGQHQGKISLSAEVIPVVLTLSADALRFTGDSNSPGNIANGIAGRPGGQGAEGAGASIAETSGHDVFRERIFIANPGAHAAEFKWTMEPDSPFSVNPAVGLVDGGKQMELEVTFRPSSKTRCEETLTMHVNGGPDRQLNCVGEVPESRCALLTKKLTFGDLPVGGSATRVAVLKNAGASDAHYAIERPMEGVVVTPVKGRIPANGKHEIRVTLAPKAVLQYETSLTINVRGGKPLRLPLSALVEMPQIMAESPALDFGAQFVKEPTTQHLVLRNTGKVTARVIIDLSGFPELDAEAPPLEADAGFGAGGAGGAGGEEDPENQEADAGSSVSAGRLGRRALPPRRGADGAASSTTLGAASTSSLSHLTTAMARGHSGAAAGSRAAPRSSARVFAVVVPVDGDPVSVPITYTPSSEASRMDSKELPVRIEGLGLVRVTVSGYGLKPRLLLDLSTLEFGERLIAEDAGAALSARLTARSALGGGSSSTARLRSAHFMNITFTNDDRSAPLSWDLDLSHPLVENGTFLIEPTGGFLESGDSCDVRVSFFPTEAVEYTARVPIYLDSQRDGVMMSLFLSGSGCHPRLSFSVPSVSLPVVPLGVESVARFEVLNQGYSRLTLSHSVPLDTSKVPVTLAFPEGLELGVSVQSLPVRVTFMSDKPVAFACKIDFFDTEGNKFSIPLSGATDCSVLTVYPFLAANPSWKVDNKLRIQPPPGAASVKDQAKQQLLAPPAPPAKRPSLDVLIQWLNANGLKKPMAASRFPADLNLANLVELVDFFSGKRSSPGTPSFEGALTFLKQHGALLTHVKAENLAAGSTDDWAALLFQVVKIFALARITPRQFRGVVCPPASAGPSSPEAAADQPQPLQLGAAPPAQPSNIFTEAEQLLLFWLSKFAKVQVQNFDTDLQNSRVLASVLLAHYPTLTELGTLMERCVTRGQYEENARKVISAMQYLELDVVPSVADLVEPEAQSLLLVVMSLYTVLPTYVPKATLEFVGRLNESCVKNVELSNPSAKPISYAVRLEGSSDFACSSSSLTLDPKGKQAFPVKFTGRFSEPVTARLVFAPKRGAGAGGAVSAIVFNLVSKVQSAKPLQELTMETSLYKMVNLDVTVVNPFPHDCVLGVRTLGSDAFWTKEQALTLKNGSKGKLKLFFLPFQVGIATCQLRFFDEEVGEFVYNVAGRCNPMAEPLETYRVQEGPCLIPYRNPLYDAARTVLVDRAAPKIPPKVDGTVTYKVEYVGAAFSGPERFAISPQSGKSTSAVAMPLAVVFNPKNPGHYTGKLVLTSNVDTRTYALVASVAAPPTEVFLEFDTRARQVTVQEIPLVNPGEAPMTVRATWAVLPPSEGATPAMIALNQAQNNPFKGASEVVVPARGRTTYVLKFAPTWMCDIKVDLVLAASSGPGVLEKLAQQGTGDHPPSSSTSASSPAKRSGAGDSRASSAQGFASTGSVSSSRTLYHLHGVAKEPLAEDHVTLQCVARRRVKHKVPVPSITGYEGAELRVESDLPYIFGEPLVRRRTDEDMYRFEVKPQREGVFSGSITFITSDGRYAWYTVEVHSAPAEPEKALSVSCEVRSGCAVEVQVVNPLDVPATFEVAIRGRGLSGEPYVTVGPNSSATYELLFAPLLAGTERGAVTFYNDSLGEFWYDLALEAKDAPVVLLPKLRCQAGSRDRQRFVVDLGAPAAENLSLLAEVSNPQNFALEPRGRFVSVARGASELELEIIYTPSSIGRDEVSDIVLSHPGAGLWRFQALGSGDPPSEMALTEIVGEQNTVVAFRNPFPRTIRVDIALTEKDGGRFFKLLTKKTSFDMGAFSAIQVPVGFAPGETMTRRSAMVVVRCAELDLAWDFPLLGVPVKDATLGKPVKRFHARVRERKEEQFDVDLAGFEEGQPSQGFQVSFRGDQAPRGLRVTALTPALARSVRFSAVFEPVKSQPKERFILAVDGERSGRWLFPVEIVVEDSEVDDTIIVEASMGSVQSVAFTVPAVVDNDPFTATFHATKESSINEILASQIVVFPPSGVMLGETQFVISYAPKTYMGRPVVANLVISTPNMDWSFRVVAKQPDYTPPSKEDVKPKVDSRRK